MKEREIIETKKVDNEIISNIEQQFDHITNPEQWLENGFDTNDKNNNNVSYFHDNNNIYSYEPEEPIKILNKINLKKVRNMKIYCYSYCLALS
jgi:hypothetical protein